MIFQQKVIYRFICRKERIVFLRQLCFNARQQRPAAFSPPPKRFWSASRAACQAAQTDIKKAGETPPAAFPEKSKIIPGDRDDG